MAGISGVGGGGSAIYPLTTLGNSDCTDCSTTGASSSAPAASQGNAGGNGTTATSPLADLRGQIETAVTDAVNQLPAGSSPQDIFSAVQGAVQSTLKANGLDPQQILSQGHGHHHHHAHRAGGGGAATGSDGDAGDQQNTNPLTSPGSTSVDALVTLLQQITGGSQTQTSGAGGQSNAGGADQTDPLLSALQNSATGAAGQTNSLLSALQNSTGGGVNIQNIFLQLFQDFPSGSGLDVRA